MEPHLQLHQLHLLEMRHRARHPGGHPPPRQAHDPLPPRRRHPRHPSQDPLRHPPHAPPRPLRILCRRQSQRRRRRRVAAPPAGQPAERDSVPDGHAGPDPPQALAPRQQVVRQRRSDAVPDRPRGHVLGLRRRPAGSQRVLQRRHGQRRTPRHHGAGQRVPRGVRGDGVACGRRRRDGDGGQGDRGSVPGAGVHGAGFAARGGWVARGREFDVCWWGHVRGYPRCRLRPFEGIV
ncbi:unnamed protein product [Linum tenue]|uniref:Uncharacterized protein n=1 Tax=Linum tenue TaxID=586396 RepID=A0AAV0HJA1_9ROSI|nr:unnamed protein product [Linum tenue]